jgi:hypothetical protein
MERDSFVRFKEGYVATYSIRKSQSGSLNPERQEKEKDGIKEFEKNDRKKGRKNIKLMIHGREINCVY